MARVRGDHPPTMLSRVLGKLDALGLIGRAPDPDDQRAVVATATVAGRAKAERIRERRTAELLDVLGRLPVDTRATLLAALPAFEELTDAIRGPGLAGDRKVGT